jgi:hypothetical protein
VSHDCACGRPIQDTAIVCPHCAHQLDAVLAEVVAYQGLAYDLDMAISRQARIGKREGARSAETPLSYNQRASDAAAHLRSVLVSWARIVHEETDPPPFGPTCRRCKHRSCKAIRYRQLPPDTLAGIAAWLRPRVGWLRHHRAGAEAWDEITKAVRDARRAVDRPAEKLFAGPCNECDTDLYAIPGALFVTCLTCGLMYEVAARREWLLGALDDHLVNATQMSRLVTYLGIKLADSSIRMYASKGRISSHGTDAKGRPLYRLGEVVRTYYSPGQKAS